MNIQQYIDRVTKQYHTGRATELSYRGDLQSLLESIAKGGQVANEPTRIKCGAPDYIITKKEIPVGYIEAKVIGTDLAGKSLKEQFDRYKFLRYNPTNANYLELHLNIKGLNNITFNIVQLNKNLLSIISFAGFSKLDNKSRICH